MTKQTDTTLFDKDLILIPSTYQSAIEAYINVPLPNAKPLSSSEKVLILLHEIKRVNFSLAYYIGKQQNANIEVLTTTKDFFITMLQEIMATQFQVTFFKKAA